MQCEGSKKHITIFIPLHCDLIKDTFWEEHKEILEQSAAPVVEESCMGSYYYIANRDIMKVDWVPSWNFQQDIYNFSSCLLQVFLKQDVSHESVS